MFNRRKTNAQDKHGDRNRLEQLSARQRKERFKEQPDRIRDNPRDTFVDIIIFLLIIAIITGLVFLYWAFSL